MHWKRAWVCLALAWASSWSWGVHADEAAIAEASTLFDQAKQLYKDARYKEGVPLAERALSIRETELGPAHPDTASALLLSADLQTELNGFEVAVTRAQRAIAIYETLHGQGHPDTATAINALGRIYLRKGDYDQAEAQFKRLLAIAEMLQPRDDLRIALALNSLATIHTRRGRYAESEAALERAIAIRQQRQGPEHRDLMAPLSNLGSLYLFTGAYSKASQLLQKSLQISEKENGLEHPTTLSLMMTLANTYSISGAFARAEPIFQRALALSERKLGPDHLTTASILNSFGVLYFFTGAYGQAAEFYQRALATREKVLGPEALDTAGTLNNLGLVYTDTGGHAQAAACFRRALAIVEKKLGPEHPETISDFHNLAHLYRLQGDYAQAEPLFIKELALYDKVLGPEHLYVGRALEELGTIYITTGAYEKAEPLLRRASALYRNSSVPEHPDAVIGLNNLGTLQWARGDFDAAVTLFRQALAIQTRNIERFLITGSEVRKQDYLKVVAKDAHRNVTFAVAARTREATVLGFDSVLQYKGRVLEVLSNNMARLRRSVRREDRGLLEELAEVAGSFSSLAFQGGPAPPNYQQRLQQLQQRQEALENGLSSRSREFRRQFTRIGLTDVQRAIPPGSVLVEWLRYIPSSPATLGPTSTPAAHYAAFVVKHAGDPAIFDLGEASETEALISRFMTAVSTPRSIDVAVLSQLLSARILAPLYAQLRGSQRLLLSPDGMLNLLPMAALRGERGRYLVEDFEIAFLTSARDLLRLDARPSSGADIVLIANPSFGERSAALPELQLIEPTRSADLDRGDLSFSGLPGTAQEAAALRSLPQLANAAVLERDNATEARVKLLRAPRILHIATHGFFLEDAKDTTGVPMQKASENPLLRSGLALTGANTRRSGPKEDGILTALEAAQLNLNGTQLVVLSACDSAVGEVRNGEGVYGLRRALVLAGAQTQVASLWKVADQPTRQLMVDYYTRLLQGQGRAAALRAAQLSMLAKPNRRHPYFWAAFVPIGNWSPLQL